MPLGMYVALSEAADCVGVIVCLAVDVLRKKYVALSEAADYVGIIVCLAVDFFT